MDIWVAIFIIAMDIIAKLVVLGGLLMVWLRVMVGRGWAVGGRGRCIGRCWSIGRCGSIGRGWRSIGVTAIGSCHQGKN